MRGGVQLGGFGGKGKPIPVDLSQIPASQAALAALEELAASLRAQALAGAADEVSRFLPYQDDPIGFVEKGLSGFLWSRQKLICESVRANRRTAVRASHDVGKSYVAAQVAAWWLSCHLPGEAFVVSTAPTHRQVKNILWREIGRAHRKGALPGRVNMTEWHIGAEIVGFGVSPADTDPTAFQGIHQRYVLVVIDEACGVVKLLWDAAKTLTTNESARILAIGNPDDPLAEFANVCKAGSGWNVIHMAAFDSPNFTGEAIPDWLRPLLVSQVWIDEVRAEYGEDSPFWIAKVLGEFPEDSVDGLIPYSAIRAAVRRQITPTGDIELGVDVARFGEDNTAIYSRQGPVVRKRESFNGRDTMRVTGSVVQAIRETGARRVKIDDTGVGGGVTDRCRELKRDGDIPKDCEIVAINVGSSPISTQGKERYVNLRAELHWAMRLRFLAGDIDIEDDDRLVNQAASLRYSNNSRGQIVIESKDEMKKRGLPSPDDFEAVMLAFAAPQIEGAGFLEWAAAQKRATEEARNKRDNSFTPSAGVVTQPPPPGHGIR